MQSSLRPWQRISSQRISANPHWEHRHDQVRLPNGALHDYHFVHTRGSVMVVPLRHDEVGVLRLVLVRQWRHLLEAPCLEFPAGGLKEGCTPADMARLELREETGFDAGNLTPLGWFNPCKGLTDERCHVFMAEALFASPLPPDSTEEFEVLEHSLEEFCDLIAAGDISDGMTLASWSLAQRHLALRRG